MSLEHLQEFLKFTLDLDFFLTRLKEIALEQHLISTPNLSTPGKINPIAEKYARIWIRQSGGGRP